MFIYLRKYNIKLVTIIILSLFLTINLSIFYSKYLDLIYEEIFETDAQIINIYEKENYRIIKLKNDNFEFFTSVSDEININKLDYINILFITKEIDFINYLKGFYVKNIFIKKLEKQTYKQKISQKLEEQHNNQQISQIFNALFFAIPVNSSLREVFTNYSISHLIALSGFHIGVISFIVFKLLSFPYNFIHKRYFPYRNRKFDLIFITIFILFSYLYFTDFVPSLTRAFVMLVIGIYLLRSNIKLISFETLAFTFLIVISLFPNFIFSIGFWFSIMAVYYIFLYIKYFKNINKYIQIFFFNFWIFFVFNPIVHYFFTQTSYEQLLSPFISIIFIVFYPFEIVTHLIGFGDILDSYILEFINYKIFVFDVQTSLWFFILFIFISLLSINSKKAFLILNFLTVCFNIYLYNS